MVSGALHVALTPQGVDAATCSPDVPQQQLDDSRRPDVLRAVCVLCPPHRIHNGGHLVRRASSSKCLVDLEQVVLGGTSDLRHGVRVIAGVVLLEQLKDTIRVLQTGVFQGDTVVVGLVGPGGLVILAPGSIVSAEDPFIKPEIGVDQERGVGVLDNVLLVIEFVIQDVLNESTQEGDISA